MQIVISESLWAPLPDDFGSGRKVVYDEELFLNREKLLSLGAETVALIVRNRTQVDAELLEAYPNLAVVGRLGVGLDNIDLDACRDRGVKVVAARGANAASVAEYVFACLFHHARSIQVASESVKEGVWDRAQATGTELFTKTLGLIGVGDIGARVALRARAFGMRTIAYDPFVPPSSLSVQDIGVELVSFNDVIEQADYISIHVPLTKVTKHLIDSSLLQSMKSSAVLINTSRGGIVDEQALAQILSRTPTQRAYLDVREQEPPGPDDALKQLENVVLTPHVAGITRESSKRVATFILTQVEAALRGGPVLGLV